MRLRTLVASFGASLSYAPSGMREPPATQTFGAFGGLATGLEQRGATDGKGQAGQPVAPRGTPTDVPDIQIWLALDSVDTDNASNLAE